MEMHQLDEHFAVKELSRTAGVFMVRVTCRNKGQGHNHLGHGTSLAQAARDAARNLGKGAEKAQCPECAWAFGIGG